MTEMVLFPNELEPGGLPDRCVVCGSGSCTPVKRQFRVSVGESNYGVVNVHQLSVRDGWVPLCPRHLQHFLSPLYALLVGCGAFGAGVVLAILVGSIGAKVAPQSKAPGFLALGILLAGAAVAVVLARFIKNGAVQESDVTEEGVRLKNLSPAFVEAVKSAREKAQPTRENAT